MLLHYLQKKVVVVKDMLVADPVTNVKSLLVEVIALNINVAVNFSSFIAY